MSTRKQTAADAYRSAQARLRMTLARVTAYLNDHQARQSEKPRDWGFVGDLEHLEEAIARGLPEGFEAEVCEDTNGGRLPERLRKELEDFVAETSVAALFGDGMEEEYVRDGMVIVGTSQMTDEELMEDLAQFVDDEDPDDDPATLLLRECRAALEMKKDPR